MGFGFAAVPPAPAYRLLNATLPACLVEGAGLPPSTEATVRADLTIADGRVAAVTPPGTAVAVALPALDLRGGMVLPGFADCHTHLDKGHIWPRRPNADGTFRGALDAVMADREANWSASDLAARMDFALRCAYAHGTVGIRTHIDSRPGQTRISWPVFAAMKERWAGRIAIEASPLFGADLALDDTLLSEVVEMVTEHGHVLGAVTYMSPGMPAGLKRLFRIADERGWDLDFHVDETLDPDATSLRLIAETAIETRFAGRVLVGHCCSLSMQADGEAARTMDLVARAGIAVVSLPMCNMYLQSRGAGRTPRQRGVTLLHELAERGVPVMVASDNTRDPFYAYGDLDLVEVYREATRMAHLDHPIGSWPRVVTSAPATLLGLPGSGQIRAGAPADLVLFKARSFSEWLSRPQADRTVLRGGAAIDTTLPDYAELDEVLGVP